MKAFNLVGVDGNAFAVMGYVSNAMRCAGYSNDEIDKYNEDAQSSDYHHLLRVSCQMVEDVNEKLRQEGEIDEED